MAGTLEEKHKPRQRDPPRGQMDGRERLTYQYRVTKVLDDGAWVADEVVAKWMDVS